MTPTTDLNRPFSEAGLSAPTRAALPEPTHLFSHLPDGLLLITAQGEIRLLNERCCTLWPLPGGVAAWQGRPAAELLAHAT